MNTCSVSCSVLLECERNCKSTFILLGTTNKTTSKVSVKKETVRVANLIHFMHFKLFFFLYYYHTKSVVSCRWLCDCVRRPWAVFLFPEHSFCVCNNNIWYCPRFRTHIQVSYINALPERPSQNRPKECKSL